MKLVEGGESPVGEQDGSEVASLKAVEGDAGWAQQVQARKFKLALLMYTVLGLLVWFTVGEGKVLVDGKPVEIRLVPLIVIGGLAFRTVVARRAARIRCEDGKQ